MTTPNRYLTEAEQHLRDQPEHDERRIAMDIVEFLAGVAVIWFLCWLAGYHG